MAQVVDILHHVRREHVYPVCLVHCTKVSDTMVKQVIGGHGIDPVEIWMKF